MRANAVRPRFQIQPLAAASPGELLQIIHQRPPDSGGALVFIGHQIIDVESPAGMRVFELAVDRHADHLRVSHRDTHFAPIAENPLHRGGIIGRQLRAQLPVHGQYFWDLFPAFLLSGIGLALAFVPMSIGALTGVQQSDAGIASGLINTSQQIGGAIGVAAATTIATTFSTHYVHAHPGVSALSGGALTHGFQITFYVLAAIAAAGAVLAAVLTESRAVTVAVEPVDAELVLEAA